MAITRFEENQMKVFEQIAQEIISGFEDVLTEKNAIATGDLINSFKYDIKPNLLRIYSTEKYAGVVDKGRGPATVDQENATYHGIVQWLLDKNITIYNYRRGKVRFVEKTASNLNTAAYPIAKKINEGGYGERYGVADFTSKTMTRLKDQITQQVGEAYFADIKKAIDTNLERMVRAKAKPQ